MLAMPLLEAVPGLPFRDAYFEMVSSLTTTGATIFIEPSLIVPSVHLWRALVGWLGGLLIWVAAIAILAPMRLGGFEVALTGAAVGRDATMGQARASQAPLIRLGRHFKLLFPVYLTLTLLVWLGLIFAGEDQFVALCHAMSTLSTSGISPLADLSSAKGGLMGEAVIALFLIFAFARVTFASDMPMAVRRRRLEDPELRFAIAFVAVVPAAMLLHHVLATVEVGAISGIEGALRSYWAGIFMTMSFLSTTGFVSADWEVARTWSGLTTPGLLLMGLALVGGGVATTAGGVKLLRVYALYKHGQLELSRLIHPHLIDQPGHRARRISLQTAFIAWLFFMIFALSVAAVMLALAATGVGFEQAVILTVATMSTTGPLIAVAGDAPVVPADLDAAAQLVLCMAMVLGRLETLAIVALFNPGFWRA